MGMKVMLLKQDQAERFVTTDHIRNLRDFGGYSVPGSGRVVKGKLFRSGDTSEASAADLVVIDRIAPTVLADLRGTSEREKAPCRWPDGLNARTIEPQGESARVAFHEEAAAQAKDAKTMREEFASRYEDLPFRPHLQQVYAEYLDAVSENDGASLVFCTAGKDRTGFIVAVLQTLLRVHPDDVLAEYLLTNAAPDSAAQVDRLRSQIEHRFGNGLTEEAIQVVTRVDPIFLQRALAAVTARCGSIESYADQALSFPAHKVESMRSRLIG
jgi:protein tyrosine/serine phosphatase